MSFVTASNGDQYHLFSIPCSVKEYTEGIQYSTLDNELSDGYWSQILFGSAVGVRSFSLTLPTLSDSLVDLVDGPYGEQLTRRAYIRALHAFTVVEGKPFVIKSVENGQYYLVRFADPKLSLQRMLVKLFTTGIELKQVRVPGVTVFDPTLMTGYDPAFVLSEATESGDVIAGPTQNGLATRRLNSVSTNGVIQWFNYPFGLPNCFDIFLVLRCNEATFGQTSGVFTDDSGSSDIPRILVGESGTTKFTNFSIPNFEYRLDGVLYEQADMQAPMQRFGIIHLRFTEGLPAPLTIWQIGQDRAIGGTKAEIDLAQPAASGQLLPMDAAREFTEHLQVKWGIGGA